MLTKQGLIAMYYRMNVTRFFNNELVDLKEQRKIYGPIHHTTGQEAIGIGVGAALREDDYITSTHRGHGHVIAKGAELNLMMAELFGKKTGYCKGKGGSMHIADMDIGVLGANGIAGGGLPIAVGAGISAKWRGTDQVTVCFFGDDSSNSGTFHESLNFASLRKAQVVFILLSYPFL